MCMRCSGVFQGDSVNVPVAQPCPGVYTLTRNLISSLLPQIIESEKYQYKIFNQKKVILHELKTFIFQSLSYINSYFYAFKVHVV